MRLGNLVSYPSGLRARMGWLVVISLLPVFCFAIYTSIQNQRERLERTDDELLSIGRHAALAGERRIEGTRQLLNAVASRPSLKNRDLGELCSVFLANIRNSSYYNNVGLLDGGGNLQCSAVPGGTASNFADRTYFKEALATKSFVIGEYQVGRITRLPSLNFGMPVYDDAGALKGVAFAALDVAKLGFGTRIPLPPGVELTITDRNGVIIGTDVSQGNRIGEQVRDQALLIAMRKVPDEAVEGVDPRGIEKIYAVTIVGDAGPARGLYVVTSVAKSAVTAPLQKELAWTLLMISALALTGVAIARWIGTRAILDPTRKLLQKVNELAGVDVSSTENVNARPTNEIVALSGAFERMTNVLKANEDERSQNEVVLRAAQGRLLDAQRIGNIGNWEYNAQADEVWWSDQTYVIYGLDKTSGPRHYDDILSRVHPDDRRNFELAQKLLWEGGRLDLEHRIVLGNGQIRWVHGLGEASFDRNGVLLTLSGTVQDITDNKRADDVRRQSESLISGVFQHAAAGICLVELDGRFIRTNQCFEQIVGRTPQELQSLTCVEATHPDDRVFEEDLIKGLIDNEVSSSTWEKRYVHPDGTVVWASLSLSLLRDAVGQPLHFIGVVLDITERRRNEATLELEADVLQGVSLGHPLQESLKKIAIGVELLIPGALGAIHLVSDDGSHLRPGAAPNLPPAYLQAMEGLWTGPAAGSSGTAAFLKEVVIVADIASSPLWEAHRHLAAMHGLKACWSVPVKDGAGKVIATFAVHHRVSRSPAESELVLINRLRYVIGIAVDQNQKEQAIRESEERFRNTFMGAATGMAICTVDGHFVQANAAYCRMVGYTEEELQQLTVRELTHPDDWSKTQTRHAMVLEDHASGAAMEKRYVARSGATVWVRISISVMSYADGQPQCIVGVAEDITQQRQAKEDLQKIQGLLKMASRVSRLGAWQVTVPDHALTWSDEVAMIYELPPGSATPTVEESIQYYSPESVPVISSAVEACIQNARPFDVELQLITARGNRRVVRAVGEAVQDASGQVIRVEGAIQDVTARRAEQTQLQLLQTAVSRLNDIVLITEAEPFDEPGPRIVFVNDAFEKRTGYKPEEVIGKSPRILQGPKTQQSELRKIGEALRKWQPIRSELINYTKDGELFWIELDIVPIADASGWYTHWVAVERDITARKQSEQEIMTLYAELDHRVQQRTAELQVVNQELEAFSYSVSHDLRAPLNTMAGFGHLLERMDGANISPKGRHYLSRIQAAATQMGELIEGLLALAQLSREKLRYEQVNLSQLARRVEAGCREREPARQVEVLIQDDLVAWGDPRLLLAALQNLIGNAWKFTARTESAHIGFFREQGLDGTVCFVVRDNGAGFDMAFADKLFGTFQRLHGPTEFSGTGVGLTIVKRVVEKHGGRVWATSKVGEGATFTFTLGPTQDMHYPAN